MPSTKLLAVVEDGVLRPLAPLNLPVGRTVELTLDTANQETPRTEEEEILAFEAALDRLAAGAAEHSEEWWDDFQRELAESRRGSARVGLGEAAAARGAASTGT